MYVISITSIDQLYRYFALCLVNARDASWLSYLSYPTAPCCRHPYLWDPRRRQDTGTSIHALFVHLSIYLFVIMFWCLTCRSLNWDVACVHVVRFSAFVSFYTCLLYDSISWLICLCLFHRLLRAARPSLPLALSLKILLTLFALNSSCCKSLRCLADVRESTGMQNVYRYRYRCWMNTRAY